MNFYINTLPVERLFSHKFVIIRTSLFENLYVNVQTPENPLSPLLSGIQNNLAFILWIFCTVFNNKPRFKKLDKLIKEEKAFQEKLRQGAQPINGEHE